MRFFFEFGFNFLAAFFWIIPITVDEWLFYFMLLFLIAFRLKSFLLFACLVQFLCFLICVIASILWFSLRISTLETIYWFMNETTKLGPPLPDEILVLHDLDPSQFLILPLELLQMVEWKEETSLSTTLRFQSLWRAIESSPSHQWLALV